MTIALTMPNLLYRVEAANLHAHLLRVTLTIAEPAAQQTVSLPIWIPGSYLVREFARHVHSIRAQQGKRACAIVQLDKCSWSVQAREEASLTVTLQVHAHDASVRTAWLDAQPMTTGMSVLASVTKWATTHQPAVESPAFRTRLPTTTVSPAWNWPAARWCAKPAC